MRSREAGSRSERYLLMDTGFQVAASIVFLLSTFSVLIMGIFANNSEAPTVLVVGSGVIFAGFAWLLLMIVVRLLARPFASGATQRHTRTGVIVASILYAMGAPALLFGVWQCMSHWMPTAPIQEANLDTPNQTPLF